MTDDLKALKSDPRVLHLFSERVNLKRDGREYVGLCPVHREKTPSFRVFQEDGTILFKCFGCPEKFSGSIIDFLVRIDGSTLPAAINKVKQFLGVETREKVEQTFRPIADQAPAKTYSQEQYSRFEESLKNSEDGQKWLASRGITLETAQRLRIGFRQDVGRLAGDENSDAASSGWLSFATFNNIHVSSIKYRSIVKKAFCKQPGMATELFNIQTIDFLEPVYLTEGELDAAALEQAGFRAVSLPNAQSHMKPEWKDQLSQAESIILAGDTDVTGSAKMQKLWTELGDRTYLLTWPSPVKDANQFLIESCGRNTSIFRTKVKELTEAARSRPMKGVYSVQQSLLYAQNRADLVNHPDRFRFSLPSLDRMAIVLPGTVTTFYSSESGMGKTNLVIQETIQAARKNQEVVVNYQAEMSEQQINTMVAANLLKKHRLHLTDEDFKIAGKMLGDNFHYYIGRNTSLTDVTEVLDLIEAASKRFGATVAVLDNLHFLCRNADDWVRAQSQAMQKITNLAGALNLKFFLVHQARKADQQHKRKSAHISDLDGSKAVQNDSSFVFSMHRKEIKNNEGEQGEYDPIVEISLQKSREKGEGSAFSRLLFSGEICTFNELTTQNEPQGMFT